MSRNDHGKDYYHLLGVDEKASRVEIDRQYKRQAARHHPDRGGNEERMKALNEAYGVLKDQFSRSAYDATRQEPESPARFARPTQPTAKDIGVFGHCLSALLCLIAGMFLLALVRFQWIWFLWPLAILALFVIGFGILMARSAMVAASSSLSTRNPIRKHRRIQELAFWIVVFSGGYGVYVLLQ